MALNLAPIVRNNQRFLFFFSSKASNNSHLCFDLKKSLLPLPLPFLSSPSLSSSSSSLSHSHVTSVSIAPVEYVPPAPEFDFHREIARLKSLRSKLSDLTSLREKHAVVDRDARVKRFFDSIKKGGFSRVLLASLDLDSYELFLVKCLVAAGQEHALGFGFEFEPLESELESARSSLKSTFYALVEMIEKLDVDGGGGNGRLGKKSGFGLEDEEIGEFKKLLKTLGEIEQFYNCIGGIIG
jgi:hypothetical protein